MKQSYSRITRASVLKLFGRRDFELLAKMKVLIPSGFMQTWLDCCLVARMISQLFHSCGHAIYTHTAANTHRHTIWLFVPFNRGFHPLLSSKDARRKDPNLSLFAFVFLCFSLFLLPPFPCLSSSLSPACSLLSPLSLASHFLFTSAKIDFLSHYFKQHSAVLSNTVSIAY